MRINAISMAYSRQNLRPQNQNVNFGRFADNRARDIAYDYLDAGNDDCGREAFNYLDKTAFVTIKSAVNKGKTFIYALAEKGAIKRHKNKSLFDDMLHWHYNGLAKLRLNKDAREAGVTDEPGFLTTLEDFTDTHNLYENFCDCEEGYYGKRGGTPSDSSKPVESNLEKGWDLYGTRN